MLEEKDSQVADVTASVEDLEQERSTFIDGKVR